MRLSLKRKWSRPFCCCRTTAFLHVDTEPFVNSPAHPYQIAGVWIQARVASFTAVAEPLWLTVGLYKCEVLASAGPGDVSVD